MATTKKDTKFTKSQLVKAKRYSEKVDLLNVLLQDGQSYTIKEVDALVEKFMKKGVK
nr:MAG TPA: hypothetical protein [Caudoviricetes sp.]